ncbi:MAG: colanic acid biosynthesis glycosyltransferase WcaL [Candidatus Scalindua sp. AMX11]|nr:MAG: colanic acid biosynthesis glycosyltransferase WcaL [Candidatus Scalindua sp.]NOG82553.1 glycosyltransferase [Planctomycetota bacterium]RZV93982.1 MAG: colanic acid biosynthesis glycosyltransferase WcaL [Candidatus Scalindua sp. SCAELEC01]TDE63975.1 MAG: colanic acid biosynthesis glycosyltransferase WcaL [Candidatus Scalindua sp. AMX11]GJQ57452.1 MAG: colanic acid biosynthesis glycosyltransferase WcaL [Candidatus Scalindua sp.]
MEIAFIVRNFPCLSETFILNQITGLIDRGHLVDIYADNPRDDTTVHADIERYDLINHTYYFHHGNTFETMPKNMFVRIIKAMALIITNFHKGPMSLLRSLNIFRFGKEVVTLNLLYKTIVFLNRKSYDVVHCHFGPKGISGAMLKDIGAIKGKVVTTFHGGDMTKFIKKNGVDVYEHLFEKGDAFLPISDRWKNELIRLGCNERKIMVHRMGIDTNKFSLSQRTPKNTGGLQILSVARLIEKKGIQYSIQAVARVLREHPNIEYKIAGDGPLRKDLEKLVRGLNIANNVKLCGWKSQEEIVELMKDADILLAPSVTGEDGDQEGIPVILMEALSQGLPVISTQHSGIPELIQDGESGFLLPERDVDGLVEKLKYLIMHQDIWPQMGQAGRKYVEGNYDINRLNDKLIDIYQRVLNNKPTEN